MPRREQPKSSRIGDKVILLRHYCTDLLECCVAIKMTLQKNIQCMQKYSLHFEHKKKSYSIMYASWFMCVYGLLYVSVRGHILKC